MLLISSSHEKQTAIKLRASRDTEVFIDSIGLHATLPRHSPPRAGRPKTHGQVAVGEPSVYTLNLFNKPKLETLNPLVACGGTE